MSVTALVQSLPSGPAVTPATLKKMAAIVRKYRTDETTIRAARVITQNVPERHTRGLIETLQGWVRDFIRYVPDPREVELVQTPPETLKLRTGDCDDKSVLLATLLETVGLATRFVAIATRGEPFFSHVMPQVRLGTKWINLETILPGVGVGWYPPDVTKFYRYDV